MTAEIERLKATWESLGSDDPFWAVLSWPGTEHGNWDLTEFFEVGERDVDEMLAQVQATGSGPRFGTALDFGCGVGRLSRALAARFEHVTGLDVSAPMIEQAIRLVAVDHANCAFVVSASESLPFADGSFDFAVALIVLQHVPPSLASRYISELVRVLKPGGVLIFQLPSHYKGSSRSENPLVRRAMELLPDRARQWIHRCRSGGGEVRDLFMHGMSRARVMRIVGRTGAQTVRCIEDQAAGPAWYSYRYVVRKFE